MASPFAEYGAAPWDELTPNPARVTPPKPGLGAVLKKPIPIWGSIKGAARAIAAPALRMGGAAAAILPAAGALASKMAGGTFSAGLDPSMMTNALGEGYARFAPTWMGGLSKSEIAAGDSQGASDIEGRFDVPMVARSAPAPVVPTGPSEGAGLYADQMATPRPLGTGLGALPPVAPMTAADIRGTYKPPSGTGAFVNNSTGAVTNLDTREVAGPGAAPVQMVDAATYDRMRGFAPRSADAPADRYIPKTAAGGFFQAGADMKTRANTEAAELKREEIGSDLAKARAGFGVALRGQDMVAQTAAQKLGVEIAGKGAVNAKTQAEAMALNERIRLAGMETDPVRRAAILAGHNPPVDSYGDVTTAMPDKSGAVPVRNNRTGEITMQAPKRFASEDNITASMAEKKMTRAKAIEAYRANGFDVSRIKP